MPLIAIIYSSTFGHTSAVAKNIADGAKSVKNIDISLIEIKAEQIQADGRWQDETIMQTLSDADAIVMGSPTYMGSVSGLMKLFMERAFDPWWVQGWKNKVAAGFTNSASRSGDKLGTLMQFSLFAMQMGMMWVGVGDPPGGNREDSTDHDVNQLGSWLGLMTQSLANVDAEQAPGLGDRHTAERFGRRIAYSTLRWKLGEEKFPTHPVSEDEAARRDRAGIEEWKKFEQEF